MEEDDDEYTIPLQDQRAFGAGIKRKRVHFVPSSSTTESISAPKPTPSRSMGDFYLSLVLPSDKQGGSAQEDSPLCEVCKLPIPSQNEADGEEAAKTRPHEASLAHQVCLTHSHPPSHLDRKRKGLSILSSYGWDPDARVGLGAKGEGIKFPIKPKEKKDTHGLGLVIPKDLPKRKEKEVKLDAGKVRKLEERDKKKRERLQEMFYRNDDVERYLGGRG